MAIFNEILAGRFNRGLQLLTGIKAGPPTPALSTEVQPGLDLNRVRVEDRYIFGTNSFWVNDAAGPVAAQNSGVQLRNPRTSGAIVVITFLGFTETVADLTAPFVQLKQGVLVTTDFSSIANVPSLDRRSGTAGSAAIISAQANAPPGPLGTIMTVPINANGFFVLGFNEEQNIMLLPGSAFQVITTAVNTLLNVSLAWYERPIEDSEHAGFGPF